MSVTTPAMGYEGKLLVRDSTRGNVYISNPFDSESLQHDEEPLRNEGIRGTRSLEEGETIGGPTTNSGSIGFMAARPLLEFWLATALGTSVVAAATEAGDGGAQLSTYTGITGVIPLVNTDASRIIYIDIVDDGGGDFHLVLWKDAGRSLEVAQSATFTGAGATILTASNASGIGGTITVDTATPAADVDITITITSMTYNLTEAIRDTLDAEIHRAKGGDTLTNGAVSKMTMSGAQGGMLQMALDLLFRNWADLDTATATNRLSGVPYAYSGLVFTYDGTAFRMRSFELVLDNFASDDHRNNSADLQEIVPKDRQVLLTGILPYSTDNEALIAQAMAKVSGVVDRDAATLVFTAPDGHTVSFSLPQLELTDARAVTTAKDGEDDLSIEARAAATSAFNDEFSVTVTD